MMIERLQSFYAGCVEAVRNFVQRTEVVDQAIKGTPAVAAAAWTMNDYLVLVTAVYVVLQIAYLARKWWREEKKDDETV